MCAGRVEKRGRRRGAGCVAAAAGVLLGLGVGQAAWALNVDAARKMDSDLEAHAGQVNHQITEVQKQYSAALNAHVFQRKPYPVELRKKYRQLLLKSDEERLDIRNRAVPRLDPERGVSGGLARQSGTADVGGARTGSAPVIAPSYRDRGEAIPASPAVDLFFAPAPKPPTHR